MTVLVVGGLREEHFASTLRAVSGDLEVRVSPNIGRKEDIRYALAWEPPPGLLKTLPNLELIVSVGAGVDHLFRDPELPEVPVVRFVDADLTGRMVEFVVLNVLLHHRRMTEFREQQSKVEWKYLPEPASHDVRVGIMGLGVLGGAASQALAKLGYRLRGWSRTEKRVDGVDCYFGNQLDAFLAETDVLVVLLPLTSETRGLINRNLLAKLSQRGRDERLPGPVLINAGRGGLQVESDILAALDIGQLYAASLDVFETEPLPETSPLWRHPRVVITPHCAAESDPRAIADYTIAQIEALRRGERLKHVVDRTRGY
jgi:glyoxylate/hydroxypyruvate reductase A